jgi:hypothetical protein
MVLGLVLEVVAEATGLVVPTSHLALFAVLAAAMVLAAITVVSLIPGASRRLAECQH